MAKSHYDQVSDFVVRWSRENAGRYEFVLKDGQRITPHSCYLSQDLANRPDRIWVNYDSPENPATDFDPLDVVAIIDIEQQCPVIDSST